MTENVYEGMFIFDSNKYARDPNGLPSQVHGLIEQCGGTMLASRLWNEQKLAYSIKGHRKGSYWLTYFRMDSGQLVKLNRECQLNENIVRNLFLRVDPRLEVALVEHATPTAAVEAGDSEDQQQQSAESEKTAETTS